MGIFRRNQGGYMDVIRCDEKEYLIWKWRPKGAKLAKSNKANAIRWGSPLRVRDGSVAVFVYTGENGRPQEFIEGPYDDIIKVENFPILAGLVGALYDGGSPIQAEVYFINMAGIIQLKFGVPYFDVSDSRFADYYVPCAVRGSITFSIEDYREFIELHRLDQFDMEDFRQQIRDALNRIVKSCVTNAPDDYGIGIAQLERRISDINAIVEADIKSNLERDFGVVVKRVDVSEIELDKSSEGYRQFIAFTQTKDISDSYMQGNAATAAAMHQMGAERILAARAENLRRDPASSVAVQQPMTQTSVTPPPLTPPPLTPPPIPSKLYFVAMGTVQTGPFTKDQLLIKVAEGSLGPSTLVWCEGMANWEPAGTIPDLQDVLNR